MSNSIIFYNSITSSYYRHTDLRINKSRPPITYLPNSLRFDVGLTYGLLRDKTNPIHEPFSTGTRVFIQHNDAQDRGTIENIPIPVSPILKCTASPSTEPSEKNPYHQIHNINPHMLFSWTLVIHSRNHMTTSSRIVEMILHPPSHQAMPSI